MQLFPIIISSFPLRETTPKKRRRRKVVVVEEEEERGPAGRRQPCKGRRIEGDPMPNRGNSRSNLKGSFFFFFFLTPKEWSNQTRNTTKYLLFAQQQQQQQQHRAALDIIFCFSSIPSKTFFFTDI
jgi:hypothetical protein